MLVVRLSEIGKYCKYLPRRERISLDIPCKPPRIGVKEDTAGIWDVMGYYDKKIVTICDKVIQEEFDDKCMRDPKLKNNLEKLSRSKEELILILRELVRLHEHSHAFLHTARIKGAKSERRWYSNLPNEVNEPLAEFITYSVINSLKDNARKIFTTVFLEFDKYTPNYYRNWKEIEQIIERSHIEIIPPLVKFARKKQWNSWADFKNNLKEEGKDEICANLVALFV